MIELKLNNVNVISLMQYNVSGVMKEQSKHIQSIGIYRCFIYHSELPREYQRTFKLQCIIKCGNLILAIFM